MQTYSNTAATIRTLFPEAAQGSVYRNLASEAADRVSALSGPYDHNAALAAATDHDDRTWMNASHWARVTSEADQRIGRALTA